LAGSSGKTKAVEKKQVKKKLGRSPDLGESLLLTFASVAGRALYGAGGGSSKGSWGQPLRRNLKGIV